MASIKELPFITILIATLNEVETIAGCIASVLSMKYPPEKYEIIIVDGGSTDGTLKIVKKFKNRFSQNMIRIMRVGRGKSLANNVGIKVARGEIIGGIDADDKFDDPYLLEKIADTYLMSGRQADLIVINGFGVPNNTSFLSNSIFLAAHAEESITRIKEKPAYRYQEVFIRRDFLIKNNLFYDEKLETNEDIDFGERIMKLNPRIVYCNEETIRLRGGGSTSLRRFMKRNVKAGKNLFTHIGRSKIFLMMIVYELYAGFLILLFPLAMFNPTLYFIFSIPFIFRMFHKIILIIFKARMIKYAPAIPFIEILRSLCNFLGLLKGFKGLLLS